MNVKKTLAYDWPTRIFHWSYAGLFVFAIIIAKNWDDESSVYAYHMLAGLTMVYLVLLRVVWGLVGSETSRFSSFKLKPSELFAYMFSVLTSKSKKYFGHNPASSYIAIIMFFLTIGLGTTGLLMSYEINKHFFEEVHEIFANGFLVAVIAHISGVLLHQYKHKDGMIFTMLSGRKEVDVDQKPLGSSRPILGLLFVTLIFVFGAYLYKSFDVNTQKLDAFALSIQLGETEDHD